MPALPYSAALARSAASRAPIRGAAHGQLDDAAVWDLLERLQGAYRELVALLLGHIHGSDIALARDRAAEVERLTHELCDIASALRLVSMDLE